MYHFDAEARAPSFKKNMKITNYGNIYRLKTYIINLYVCHFYVAQNTKYLNMNFYIFIG
jgi:hypothetical protein